MVEIDPEKLGGTPILKGSRMPAYSILENHLDGMTPDEIAEVFELPAAGVRELLGWVKRTHPDLQLWRPFPTHPLGRMTNGWLCIRKDVA